MRTKLDVKVVKIPYSYFGRQPNHKKVAKRIYEMEAGGWKLQHRHEAKAGLLALLCPLFIGHTELTFIRPNKAGDGK